MRRPAFEFNRSLLVVIELQWSDGRVGINHAPTGNATSVSGTQRTLIPTLSMSALGMRVDRAEKIPRFPSYGVVGSIPIARSNLQ